jgi:sulfite oxidase
VSIGGLVSKPLSLGLEEIRRYKKQQVEALLMCAGNRRLELNAIKKVTGTAWGAGGLGNALWGGVPLRELLLAAGVQSDAKHVWFEGLDEVKSKDKDKAPFRFGGSIPLSFVMDAKQHEPLLCYEMNEQPLTVEHGAPLRIVVPGVIGARSVKWLSKITLSEQESPNPILQHSYKLVASADTKELEQAAPLYTFPVNGYICTPAATTVLPPGKIKLAGYAMATGAAGAVVKRVSLRVREGKTWSAKLLGDAKPFAWQLWEAEVELGRGEHEIALNVTDSLGKSQPDDLPWNYLGYLNNGQQRLTLRVG